MMSDEFVEAVVEEIMRMYHFGDYEAYSNEELREQYRQAVREKGSEGQWPLQKPMKN